MTTGLIVALALVVPIILIPAALVWYINVSGIYTVIRETQKRRAARRVALKVKA